MLSDLLKFQILSQKYVMELLHGSTVPNMTMYNICILFVDQEFLKSVHFLCPSEIQDGHHCRKLINITQ